MSESNTPEIRTLDSRSLDYAEDFVLLDELISQTRDEAITLGVEVPSTGALAFLTFIAKTIKATNVVEIGTGTGSSGLALLAGMTKESILTSIDSQADWQQLARQAFRNAGLTNPRFRLINGTALEVLDNLRQGAYDLVFINGDKLEYVEYVAQGQRLLRDGGVMVINDVLWKNLVANPSDESDETLIIREALQALLDSEEFTPVMLPLSSGLVAAVKG
uniref:O-methyltransferase n=1 Tax=Vaginimicrobium propionicum TaxID=1871034 RepID=UPI0009FA9FB2|nr:O-methyltransferase [Vaginimicrobium propionicum]